MRTSDAKVRSVIEVEEDNIDLSPFITAANELVTELCVPAGYGDSRLEVIETWLAAHFFAIREPRLRSESAGVSMTFEGETRMFLEGTKYGQQVMMLDTQGALAALHRGAANGKGQIGMFWLGTEHE